MSNIVITHSGATTIIRSDSTPISFTTSAATVTAVDDTTISVTVGGVPIITMDIADIVSIDGAKPYGNAGDIVTQITNEGGGGSASYLVYTALLTQTGTDAPVATVTGSNTIGNIVWTRDGEGSYLGTLSGAFPEGRTLLFPSPLTGTSDSLAIGRTDANSIYIFTATGGVAADGYLFETSLEIRVYPAP